jgi:RNA polymerase sigma factor (sigma-70 family)
MTPLFTSALLSTQSDERLVLLVRDGRERAFDAIVDRYRKPLQRYCERALPKSRAEDVVQQVLTKAWCAFRDGTEVRSLKPWLYRIAATTVLETARTPGYEYDELRRSLLVPEGPEAELEQQAVIRRTLAGLATLPEAQREALRRDAFEGQSRAQIAEALGVSEEPFANSSIAPGRPCVLPQPRSRRSPWSPGSPRADRGRLPGARSKAAPRARSASPGSPSCRRSSRPPGSSRQARPASSTVTPMTLGKREPIARSTRSSCGI